MELNKANVEAGGSGKADEPAPISSSDQIVRDVVRGIYESRYVAGQRLAEPDLMRRYGVARSTVREAIKRLAAEGVVETHQFRGAQIRHLSLQEAQNVLLILELLVGLAARQAAAAINAPGCRAAFEESCGRLLALEHSEDSWDFVRARNNFYRTMTQIAGNSELGRLLPNIQVHLVRAHLRISREQRFADYRAIRDAILCGDIVLAEEVARAHIAQVANALDGLANAPFSADKL